MQDAARKTFPAAKILTPLQHAVPIGHALIAGENPDAFAVGLAGAAFNLRVICGKLSPVKPAVIEYIKQGHYLPHDRRAA